MSDMRPMPRSLRMLPYRLKDVEDALRREKKQDAALDIARAARQATVLTPEDFLEVSRSSLMDVLLGERDLPKSVIDDVLDVVAMIDQATLGLR